MVILLILNFLLSSLFCSDPIDQASFPIDDKAIEKKVEKTINSMTIEQKIGQMMMFGFKGKKNTDDVFRLIDKYHAGGFLIFTRNVEDQNQLVSFNKALQKYSRQKNLVPSFIAIDQEGGKVLRIKSFGTVLPGNMNIGATRSAELSFLAGKLTAIDLEMMGINVNFAPVLDVNTSKYNDVIGVRSFGSDPDMVSKLGTAYIRGIQSRRVSATAKHFPGHGNTSGDSHFEALSLNRTYDEMKEIDLKPFYEAIANGVDAIMTGHISVPKIDPSGVPATLSKKILTGILRNQMNYDGLIVTDDMEMRSITKDGGITKAAVEAVLAGCDVITIVWTDQAKEDAYTGILNAVQKGIISEARIDASVRRILKTKIKRRMFEEYTDPNIEEVRRVVGNKLHQQIAQLIAERSITVVKNLKKIVPFNATGRFVVVSPFSYLSEELNVLGLNNTLVKMKLRLSHSEAIKIANRAMRDDKNADAYLVAVLDQSQTDVANIIKKYSQKPVIVASLDSPYVYSDLINADAYLCAYSFRTQALKALADVLAGKSEAVGILPVVLDNTYTPSL